MKKVVVAMGATVLSVGFFAVCFMFATGLGIPVNEGSLEGPENVDGVIPVTTELPVGHVLEFENDLKIVIKKDNYVDVRKWESLKPTKHGVRLNKNDWKRFMILAPTLDNVMGMYHVNDKIMVHIGQVKNVTLTNGENAVTIPATTWLQIREKMSFINKTLLIKYDP